jgi:hypothetical protein
MRIDKLFQVLVVAGASSTVGLNGCSSSSGGSGGEDAGGPGTDGAGASSSSGGSSSGGSSSSGSSSSGGTSADGSACMCGPDPQVSTWTDCNGCCCWLAAGVATPSGVTTPICGVEPCCAGKGPGR